jgi:hypothetical protein
VVTLQVADSVLQVLFFFVAVIQQCVMSNKAQVEHKKANCQGAKAQGVKFKPFLQKTLHLHPALFGRCAAL